MILGAIFAVILIGCALGVPGKCSTNHMYVAVALVPASALLCLLLGQVGPSLALQLVALGGSVGEYVRPLSNIGVVTFLDVECMTLFLLACYGSMVVLRHLVDIVRILKVSKRRAVQWSA